MIFIIACGMVVISYKIFCLYGASSSEAFSIFGYCEIYERPV